MVAFVIVAQSSKATVKEYGFLPMFIGCCS